MRYEVIPNVPRGYVEMLYPGARFVIINNRGMRVTLGTIVNWVSLDGDLLLELEDE